MPLLSETEQTINQMYHNALRQTFETTYVRIDLKIFLQNTYDAYKVRVLARILGKMCYLIVHA